MKPRIRRILGSPLLGLVMAALTILILHGRDRAIANSRSLSLADRALSTRIDKADFRGIEFEQAVMQLVQQAGGRVELDGFATDEAPLHQLVRCSIQNVPLSAALKMVISAAGEDCVVRSSADGKRVRIERRNAPPAPPPLLVNEYPIPDLIGSGSTPPPPLMSSFNLDIAPVGYHGVQESLELLSGQRDLDQRLLIVSPHLLILGTASEQNVFARVFATLQPGATSDDRRVLPPGTELFDLVNGKFVPRDHYPARDALRTVFPGFKVAPQRLEDALVSLAKRTGVKIVLDDDEVESFPKVKLDPKPITLADAIDSLLHQASPNVGSFAAEGDVVRVTPKLVPNALRVYNLHAYISELPPAACEAGATKLAESIDAERADYLGQSLVVRAGWFRLEETEAALLRLVSGHPPDEGGKAQ